VTVRFGTDGVRGLAGRDLTPEIATAIGRASVNAAGQGGDRWSHRKKDEKRTCGK